MSIDFNVCPVCKPQFDLKNGKTLKVLAPLSTCYNGTTDLVLVAKGLNCSHKQKAATSDSANKTDMHCTLHFALLQSGPAFVGLTSFSRRALVESYCSRPFPANPTSHTQLPNETNANGIVKSSDSIYPCFEIAKSSKSYPSTYLGCDRNTNIYIYIYVCFFCS